MTQETLHIEGMLVVQRLTLQPSEATPWHVDPYPKVQTVLSGDSILIEFENGDASEEYPMTVGEVDIDPIELRRHRAVNNGTVPIEVTLVFLLDKVGADPQPERMPS